MIIFEELSKKEQEATLVRMSMEPGESQIPFLWNDLAYKVDSDMNPFRVSMSPYGWQWQIIRDLDAKGDSSALIGDCGIGKTCIFLWLWQIRMLGRLLVLCPKSTMNSAWMEDIEKFAPHAKAQVVWHSNMKKRIDMLQNDSDIDIVNYDAVNKLYPYLIKNKYDMIVLDESTFIKNRTSKRSRNVLKLQKHIKYRHIATATPGTNPEQYWSQWWFIDPKVWPGNGRFTPYRERYFHEIEQPDGISFYVFNKKYINEINERLMRVSVRVKKEDVQKEMPPRNFHIRMVNLPPKAMSAYNKMRKESVAYVNDETVLAEFPITERIKLLQMANGFIINDLRGKERVVQRLHNSKLAEVTTLIEDIIPEEEPVIIWANYDEEFEVLKEQFGYPCINGKTRNNDQTIKDFKQGKLKGVIAHPQSCGHGITWIKCCYAIYFSLPQDTEILSQSMDRIHRNGQKRLCNYFMILARKTIDEQLWRDHASKRKLELSLTDDNTFIKRMVKKLISIGEI